VTCTSLEVTYRPIFSPEDGDSMFLRNVDICRRVHTAPKPRRIALSQMEVFLRIRRGEDTGRWRKLHNEEL
jgi:hypothetical protein